MTGSGRDQRDRAGDSTASDLHLLRVLLLDALAAGKFLLPGEAWQPHHRGQIVHFMDRTLGIRRPGCLVLADEITNSIIDDSITDEYRSYLLVGGRLHPEVDLGHARALRKAHAADADYYWACFILATSVLVSSGTPPSSCRLIGEVINLQMPQPFIQQRVCTNCHALNSYASIQCVVCGDQLTATGRLD